MAISSMRLKYTMVDDYGHTLVRPGKLARETRRKGIVEYFGLFLHEHTEVARLLEYEIQQSIGVEIRRHDTVFGVVEWLSRQRYYVLRLKGAVSVAKKK